MKKNHSKGILKFREDFCALATTVYLSDVCKIKTVFTKLMNVQSIVLILLFVHDCTVPTIEIMSLRKVETQQTIP